MKENRRLLAVTLLLIVITISACQKKTKVDFIVHNGSVYTVDSAFRKVEAFAVSDGRIIHLGTNKDILDLYAAKEVIDLDGKAVYPGIIDSHVHFVWYGQSLFSVDLKGSTSYQEVIDRVVQFAKSNPGQAWIDGRGWDQNLFTDREFPTNEKLNELFPDIPVVLHRIDAHALLANDAALKLASIRVGQIISGGEIIQKNGKLTGVLVDNASRLLLASLPKPSASDFKKWLQAAEKKCFENGITTVVDCGLDYEEALRIDSIQQRGELSERIYVMLNDKKSNYDFFLPRGPYKTDKLFVKGFKLFADGALGSRGACLLQPYRDKPNWKGFLLSTPEHIDSVAAILSKTNFQLCTHAIGDSTNRLMLNIYNKHLSGKNDKRWRIEHAQLVHKNDFSLFGQSSIIPSVMPTAAISDMTWAVERINEQVLTGGYAYKKLLDQNGWITLGTDFPVDDINPMKTFYSAVYRRNAEGLPNDGFQMENALTRVEALRGVTYWGAKAAYLEKECGSLEPGKWADFIVVDQDIMEAKESQLLQVKVLSTFLGGRKVYEKTSSE